VRYRIFLTVAAMLFAGTAAAYVGPGAGISLLGALWGLIIGVVMAVGVILFWPIRMLIRKAKANKAGTADNAASDGSATQASESEAEDKSAESASSSSQTP
jgi:hypothetical protein